MKIISAVAALSALAQECRLNLFRLLVKRGPEGYTQGEIIQRMKIPAPTISFHLKALAAASLVDVRRQGRFLYYSANFGQMSSLVAFLTEQCCALATGDCPDAACNPPKTTATRRKPAA